MAITAHWRQIARLDGSRRYSCLGLFVFESPSLTFLVDNKKRYLVQNYMNLVIILIGLPVLWGDFSYAATLRAGRLIVLLVLLVSLFDTLITALSKYKLSLTFLVAGFVVVISGILISSFDPGIKSPGEGIWWAWVTVTTVGYGDVVPTSALGKFIAMILIGIGIGLFSVLTASFSALFISRQEEKVIRKEREMLKTMDEISTKLDKLEKKINKLDKD